MPESREELVLSQICLDRGYCTLEQLTECIEAQSQMRSEGKLPRRLDELLEERGFLTAQRRLELLRELGLSSSQPRLGGFEILEEIGKGSMGTVFKARQIALDRTIALKVMPPHFAKDPSAVDRFKREAKAAARLGHPNLVSAIDYGTDKGFYYFAMEYVEGQSAKSILEREGRLEERRVLYWVLGVARALDHAHQHGLVHRDVKPENILVAADGTAKLCDLGLVKERYSSGTLTQSGMSVGTPSYISPEQARGDREIDIRSDLYSLGASLYHLLSGAPPFEGPTATVIMTKHILEEPPPLSERAPWVSERARTVLGKLLEKHPENRYQTPQALIGDLERILSGRAPVARVPSRTTQSTLWQPSVRIGNWRLAVSGRKIAAILGTALVLALVTALAVLSGVFERRDPPERASLCLGTYRDKIRLVSANPPSVEVAEKKIAVHYGFLDYQTDADDWFVGSLEKLPKERIDPSTSSGGLVLSETPAYWIAKLDDFRLWMDVAGWSEGDWLSVRFSDLNPEKALKDKRSGKFWELRCARKGNEVVAELFQQPSDKPKAGGRLAVGPSRRSLELRLEVEWPQAEGQQGSFRGYVEGALVFEHDHAEKNPRFGWLGLAGASPTTSRGGGGASPSGAEPLRVRRFSLEAELFRNYATWYPVWTERLSR